MPEEDAESVLSSSRWIERRPTRGWRLGAIRHVWAYRQLAGFLVWRDLKLRYRQTALGVAWAVIEPTSAAVAAALIFGRAAQLPSEGLPYGVFALTGFVAWTYLSESILAATDCLTRDRALVTKVAFPRLVAPMAAVTTPLVDLGVSLVIVALAMVLFGVAPSVWVLLLPAVVVWLVAVALAFGSLLSSLQVQYRDVRYATGLLIQVLLLASPVAYSASLIPSSWRWLYYCNPMAGAISAFRASITGSPLDISALTISPTITLVLLVAGLAYFQRREPRFADVI
jgi:lipopolysaccharide transport system permease protein